MRKAMSVLVTLVCFCFPAQAQDWSGPYIGVTGTLSANQTINSIGRVTGEFGGVGAGALAGYRFNAGSFVIGVEATSALLSAQKTYGSDELYQLHFEGSVRATAGIPIGQFLPYAAFGIAATNAQYEGPTAHSQVGHVGVNLGAGVEAALADSLSARAEISVSSYGLGDYGPWHSWRLWVRPASTKLSTSLIFRF